MTILKMKEGDLFYHKYWDKPYSEQEECKPEYWERAGSDLPKHCAKRESAYLNSMLAKLQKYCLPHCLTSEQIPKWEAYYSKLASMHSMEAYFIGCEMGYARLSYITTNSPNLRKLNRPPDERIAESVQVTDRFNEAKANFEREERELAELWDELLKVMTVAEHYKASGLPFDSEYRCRIN